MSDDKPILMSGPMVRSTLDDTKTETRRGMKFDPHDGSDYANCAENLKLCPYGAPGSKLWVKETWGTNYRWDDVRPSALPSASDEIRAQIHYRADFPSGVNPERLNRWRPSIFMPRALSRITLVILTLRIERLNDITEAGAIAEGVEKMSHGYRDYLQRDVQFGDALSSYCSLWDSINGVGSWDKNEWVWVIGFRRIKP